MSKRTTKRVVLVHWNEAECLEREAVLRQLGYEVHSFWNHAAGSDLTRALVAAPPAAIVVDLTRLPAHGRAIATWVRSKKTVRGAPLVFVPGDKAKTKRVRETFPDAAYAPWSRMPEALPRAIAAPPASPVVPKAPDYSGTPLPQKLGLKPDGRFLLVRAPRGFRQRLGDLPEGVEVATRVGTTADTALVFCRALAELRADFPRIARTLAPQGGLWVAWPKKSSGMQTDLDENKVRAYGLGQGLVDVKVCAIDAVWSGLRFARRRVERAVPAARVPRKP